MSLNSEQRERTARELRANLERSGLDEPGVLALTGWTSERLRATLAIDRADPVDVWRLRDVLERAVVDAGGEPVPFTVLTDSARAAARGWFGISEPDRA